MAYRVTTPHVGFRDESGESHVLPRGEVFEADSVPEQHLKFWAATGQVEEVAETTDDDAA